MRIFLIILIFIGLILLTLFIYFKFAVSGGFTTSQDNPIVEIEEVNGKAKLNWASITSRKQGSMMYQITQLSKIWDDKIVFYSQEQGGLGITQERTVIVDKEDGEIEYSSNKERESVYGEFTEFASPYSIKYPEYEDGKNREDFYDSLPEGYYAVNRLEIYFAGELYWDIDITKDKDFNNIGKLGDFKHLVRGYYLILVPIDIDITISPQEVLVYDLREKTLEFKIKFINYNIYDTDYYFTNNCMGVMAEEAGEVLYFIMENGGVVKITTSL